MKKLFALVLAVLMVMMCFAACGGETGSTTPNGGSAGSNTATNPSNDPTDGNAEKPTIVVGYTNYAPMNYEDENGVLVGFDTELAKAVFENMGYEVMFQLIDWGARYTDLNSGTIDCIWNGFTCNTADSDDGIARSEKVDFSYNYMENRQVIVAKTDSGIATAADLAGKVAGVEIGSAGETYANGFDDVMVTGFDYQTTALFEVKSGTVDFAVLDAQLAKSYCGKGDYADVAIVDGLSSDVEYYAIGFRKGSDLTAKVNAELEKLAADGTIATLAEKYGVSNTAITDFSDQK
ncbi:MAG: transporter substrate-binding domain-containing protein [Oscillospiraceae bacterium]|nr:transporter substrate-binding domain-containing protein [Oscillospiraceae bacterium]